MDICWTGPFKIISYFFRRNSMNKILNVVLSFFAVIIGIGCAVAGIVQFANRDKYDLPVIATVATIQEEWETATTEDEVDRLVKTAYIEYEVNGVKYGPVLAPTQKDSYSVGDTVEILCQSKNPEKFSDSNVTTTALLFVGLGALVAVIGGVTAVKSIKSR